MILPILSYLLWLAFWAFIIFIIGFYITRALLRIKIHMKSNKLASNKKRLVFFHPYWFNNIILHFSYDYLF